MRTRGPRLGEVLEQRGWVTREQLLRALRNQKVVGGRLGTCLLEIDALSEDVLLKALAEHQGVPSATPDDLRGIPSEVIRLIPAKVARRLLAIPFRSSGSSAHVAVFEARDLGALDELAFVTGRRVRVCVATEVRLVEALEKYYGEECPARFGKLLDRLNRARFLWAGDAPRAADTEREMLQWDPKLSGTASPSQPASQGLAMFGTGVAPDLPEIDLPSPQPAGTPAAAANTAPPPAAEAAPPAPALPLATPASAAPEPEVAAPPTAPSPDPIAPPPPPVLSFEEAERRLLNPTERDDVGRALLEFGVGHARRAILFRIHRDEVAGWMAAGEGLDTDSLLAYRGALDRPSVFFTLHRGAPLIRGPLSDLPAHEPLRAALAGQTAIDALALPITVRDRLVAVLYLEPRGTAFAPTEVAGLQRLTAKAAIAFELCIMRSKLRRA